MVHWIFVPIAFIAGMALMALLKRQPDNECRNCDMAYRDTIRRMEEQIHGLKSSKGKLGKELQSMAFRNSGFNGR